MKTGLTNDLFSGYQVKGIISLISARGGQRTSCPPLRFSGGKPMKTINLRWMYPHYRHDEFVDVTDEVWAAMYQPSEMENYERRKVYHRAYYSLDAYSWLENYALEHSRSPEDILLEREEMTTPPIPDCSSAGGSGSCHPTGPPCSHYYIAGIKQPEIARERVSIAVRSALPSTGGCGICAAAMMTFFKQSEACLCRPSISNNIIHFAKRTFCGGVR